MTCRCALGQAHPSSHIAVVLQLSRTTDHRGEWAVQSSRPRPSWRTDSLVCPSVLLPTDTAVRPAERVTAFASCRQGGSTRLSWLPSKVSHVTHPAHVVIRGMMCNRVLTAETRKESALPCGHVV
jgi:hypothetical protein